MDTFGFKVTSRWLWLHIQYTLIPAPGCWIRPVRCGGGGIKRVGSVPTSPACHCCSPCVKLQAKQSKDEALPVAMFTPAALFEQMEWKFHDVAHGNESYMLLLLVGMRVPGNESSKERRFQGMKVPENENSTYGKFSGSKVPVTVLVETML